MIPSQCADPLCRTCYWRWRWGLATTVCPRLTAYCPKCRLSRLIQTYQAESPRSLSVINITATGICGHRLGQAVGERNASTIVMSGRNLALLALSRKNR